MPLIIALIRTDKLDSWGIIAVSKDKVSRVTLDITMLNNGTGKHIETFSKLYTSNS